MRLNSFTAAYHENCKVKNAENPLCLSCKIPVPRGVQQCYLRVLPFKNSLLREDCNASFLLQWVSIQEGISMVYSSGFSDGTAGIEKSLGQGGLSRVNMSQNSCYQLFATIQLCSHIFSHVLKLPIIPGISLNPAPA